MTVALRQRPLTQVVNSIVKAGNGCWLDPSDMSTLYQDAAGTIPVTAVEQPVGKIIDKSGNGNHATQSVTASRPTLSARKNILLATETLATQSVTSFATQSVTSFAVQYTLSFTGTGSVTLSGTATGTLTGTGVNDRVSLTVTPTAGTLTLTVSGSVTKAQLELGASAGSYQRVNTATDYDTDPRYFPKYLRFDGVDDYLNLPYMGLYANGSASVVAALIFDISKLGNLLLEGCSTIASSAYGIYQKLDATLCAIARNDINVDSLSTSSFGLSPFTYRAVVSFTDTGNSAAWFRNTNRLSNNLYTRSGVVTLNTLTLGAWNNSAGIVGRIGLSLYGLIITKSALTDAQRVRCERFLARKAGVML